MNVVDSRNMTCSLGVNLPCCQPYLRANADAGSRTLDGSLSLSLPSRSWLAASTTCEFPAWDGIWPSGSSCGTVVNRDEDLGGLAGVGIAGSVPPLAAPAPVPPPVCAP